MFCTSLSQPLRPSLLPGVTCGFALHWSVLRAVALAESAERPVASREARSYVPLLSSCLHMGCGVMQLGAWIDTDVPHAWHDAFV